MKRQRLFALLMIIMTQRSAVCLEFVVTENETELFYSMSCRTERGFYLSPQEYHLDTCARCYYYLPPFAFRDYARRLKYDESRGVLVEPGSNTSLTAGPGDPLHPAYATFRSDVFGRQWMACCREALACCALMLSEPISFDNGSCPRTWDGWQCWPASPAGETAQGLCQDHVYFKSDPSACPRFALKQCLSNGTWYVDEWGIEWTNYSSCGRIQGLWRLQYFHIVTYAVSLLFLIPALFIFSIYKQLQVYRITMHKNLFTALLLNALSCVVFKGFVILEDIPSDGTNTVFEENGLGCKALCLLTKYTRMTTYMWMFCEGFYLHKLIAASFAEQKSLAMFYFIGWVFPIFPVFTFAILRWYYADVECWALPLDPYEWITNSPNLLSLVLNLAFLCNIIRVLVTKLRATHTNEPSQFRKAVRATLVLVPLFGLHFFLVLYRPKSEECSTFEGYTFLKYSMDGLQGFLVSLIFCYLNGEIQGLVRRSIQRMRIQRTLTSSSEWRRSTRSEPLSKMVATTGGRCKRGAVTDLVRRSACRMHLRYAMAPSTLPLSDLPMTFNNRPTYQDDEDRRDSYSIEEIQDIF